MIRHHPIKWSKSLSFLSPFLTPSFSLFLPLSLILSLLPSLGFGIQLLTLNIRTPKLASVVFQIFRLWPQLKMTIGFPGVRFLDLKQVRNPIYCLHTSVVRHLGLHDHMSHNKSPFEIYIYPSNHPFIYLPTHIQFLYLE